MNTLWEVLSLFLELCQQFVVLVYSIKNLMDNTSESIYQYHLKRVFEVIVDILQLLYSEGYCYYIDFLSILYYNSANHQHALPLIIKTKVANLTEQDARDMTGLSVLQLHRLHRYLRITDDFLYRRQHVFIGKECVLHYLVFNRTGETKLRMSHNYFSGDPRWFTYSIRIMTSHSYKENYHKVSSGHMQM